jgi:hypothetical protein
VLRTLLAAGLATVQDFYTDERAKLLFRASLCTLVNRVNSVSGRRYRDDPAIFSWELMERPKSVLADALDLTSFTDLELIWQ